MPTTVMSRMEITRYVKEKFEREREALKRKFKKIEAEIEDRTGEVESLAQHSCEAIVEQANEIQWLRTQIKCLKGLINATGIEIEVKPESRTSNDDFLGYERTRRSGAGWSKPEEDWLMKMFEDEMANRLMVQGYKQYGPLVDEVLNDLANCNGRTGWANKCRMVNNLGYVFCSKD